MFASLDELAARARLWRCAQVGARVRVRGRVVVHGHGRIVVGDDVSLDGREVPIELFAGPGAELVIGDGCVLAAGVSLEAHRKVALGPRCTLDRLAKVMDSNFHAVNADRLAPVTPAPVLLDEGVKVGERSIVLPGAHLEAGVTLLPYTVVSRRVRAGATLRGCPARAVEKVKG
ncbi:MAG: acetyltransferase [Myxococcaceae bacterium]|nr:acetyltransferase [Myxococcaceae bacterium]